MVRANALKSSGSSSVRTKLRMPSECSASATKPERSAAPGSVRQRGSSTPSTAISIGACWLSVRRCAVKARGLVRIGEVGLGDHDAVGEDRLLARLSGPVERRYAAHRVDGREHHLDEELSPERAVGREGLQDRPRIGEP